MAGHYCCEVSHPEPPVFRVDVERGCFCQGAVPVTKAPGQVRDAIKKARPAMRPSRAASSRTPRLRTSSPAAAETRLRTLLRSKPRRR